MGEEGALRVLGRRLEMGIAYGRVYTNMGFMYEYG